MSHEEKEKSGFEIAVLEALGLIIERQKKIMATTTQLLADVATLNTNVALLIAAENTIPVQTQTDIDAADANVNAINAQVVAATPAAPVTPATTRNTAS